MKEELYVLTAAVGPKLFPGRVVRYKGKPEHRPDWLIQSAEPYPGAAPPYTFDYDGDAVAREVAEAHALFNPPPVPAASIVDMKKRLGFVRDEQLTCAIANLGCPAGHLAYLSDPNKPNVETVREWSEHEQRAVAKWEDAIRTCFPNALPTKR